MVPALPDLSLAPSYASLPVAGPRAQIFVATLLHHQDIENLSFAPPGHLLSHLTTLLGLLLHYLLLFIASCIYFQTEDVK